MSDDFPYQELFDEDYLYFYEESILTDARNTADVELVARLIEGKTAVLDCPCGHGRIANALAERGHRVTGLDRTELFLDLARADARTRGVDVEYVHGDMRELPWTGRFDAVVNWFTSFGYFDDETNRSMLRQFHDALKPGGRLVLELQNPPRLFRILAPATFVRRGDDLMVDVHEVDWETWRMNGERIIIRDGDTRRTRFQIRLYGYPELRRELFDAGFADVRPGLPPDQENRLVVVADRGTS